MVAVSAPVTVTIEDGVAVARLDDGKANAVSHAVIDGLNDALDQAAAEATALAVIGRDGKFSAGYDLGELGAGPEATKSLLTRGGELLVRIFNNPQPVVLGVTGHALAAGALLCLASDYRVGAADVPAKIGLNETAIGMGLPWYGVRLGEARLSMRHRQRAVLHAEIYDMAGAVDAGFLDEAVPVDDLADRTVAKARELGQLPANAFGFTKKRLRQAVADELLAGLDADTDLLAGIHH